MAQRQISVAEGVALFPILNPKAVGFAGYSEAGWDLDTDLLIQNFAREARGNGASFQTNARVTGLERTAAGWRARTADGEYSGSVLINAAGAWANVVAELAGISGPRFMPLRRSMARIPAPGGLDVSSWPLVDGAGEGWYAKPDAGALIVSPAEEFLMEPHDAWADDMVLAEGLARYEDRVTEPVTRLLASWAGLRTFSPDRVPLIGFAPGNSSFFWLAGQGGYGFQSSPAASALVADLIGGRAPAMDAATIAALSPARFPN
jgi:glycine/D-amino acid oxidase-like deaminating enzyme